MPVQCPRCHALNRDTASYCDACGAGLSLTTEATTRPVERSRPASLPEEGRLSPPHDVQAARGMTVAAAAPVRLPRRRAGPSVKAWIAYLCLLMLGSFVVFLLLLEAGVLTTGGTLGQFLLIAMGLFVLTVSTFVRRVGHKELVGTVSQLRQTNAAPAPGKPHAPATLWSFLLQPADANWQPVVDRQGFLMPVIEVTFAPQDVHGAALDEGSRVTVRGKVQHDAVRAKGIWNLTSAGPESTAAGVDSFWGRVTNLQPPAQIQDTRSPDPRFLEVRSFRLQPTSPAFELLRDAGGDLVEAIPVEIRARVITGALQEGDRVELRGQYVHGMLNPREVLNHSAGGAALAITGWTGLVS